MFSHLSRIVAVIVLIAGVADYLLGTAIAFEWLGPYKETLARYAPFASGSGEMIDRGVREVAFALALGTLAEISLSLRRASNPAAGK